MSARAAFCMKCGSPLEPGARFCMKCGASTPDAVAASGAGSGARIGTNPAVIARQALSVGGTVASMGGLLSLPWQTIVAGETPDVRRLIAAGAPIAQRAVLASLRRPAIALLVTTLLDLAVALVTARPGALKLVGLRAAMGVGTAVLGMIVGNKAGPLRQVTGAASMLTGLVQTGSMLFTAFSAAISPVGLLGLVPSIVSQASSLVMLVKTAIVSLKQPGRERHNPQTISANAG